MAPRFHRRFIGAFEAWLRAQGAAELVPIPYWDPSTPLPSEFADPNPANPRCTMTPNLPLPAWATVTGGTMPAPLFGHAIPQRSKNAAAEI